MKVSKLLVVTIDIVTSIYLLAKFYKVTDQINTELFNTLLIVHRWLNKAKLRR